MNSSIRLALVSLVIGLCGACGPTYAYAPTTSAPVTLDAQPAADFPLPQERPTGNVRIASFGFIDLGGHGKPLDEAHYLHALHLRMVITNKSTKDWTVDTREQRVDLTGRGRSAAAFVTADMGTPPPVISVVPGGRRVVDLFYPLPPDEQSPAKLPEFDAVFTVTTDRGAVTAVASFDRIVVKPVASPDDYGPEYWWGPPYWVNTAYQPMWFGDVSNLPQYQEMIPPMYMGQPAIISVHGEHPRR